MKTLKHFFLIVSLAVCSITLQSCNKEDIVRLSTAIVTVRPNTALNSVEFKVNDELILHPVNITGTELGKEERRALIEFRKPTDSEALPMSSIGPQVYVTWIKLILTKQLAENMGSDEANAEQYGQDPVEIVNDWVTLAEDGYMNLCFRTMWGGMATHYVNMVYTPEPDNPYCVTFYHDAMGDAANYQNDALVAFRLSDLPDTNGQTVDLKVKWNSFSGPKSTTFKYCTRKETNSISSVISQPSLATIPMVDGIY